MIGDGGNEADAEAYLKQVLRQRRRAARPAAATRPPPSPAAPATSCSPTRTRRSSPGRAARTSTTSSRTDTLLIENPCALTEDARDAAKAFLDFLKSTEARSCTPRPATARSTDVGDVEVEGANDPADPFPDPETLLTIDDDFGGWAEANTKYFDENDGILTKLQADAGQ